MYLVFPFDHHIPPFSLVCAPSFTACKDQGKTEKKEEDVFRMHQKARKLFRSTRSLSLFPCCCTAACEYDAWILHPFAPSFQYWMVCSCSPTTRLVPLFLLMSLSFLLLQIVFLPYIFTALSILLLIPTVLLYCLFCLVHEISLHAVLSMPSVCW